MPELVRGMKVVVRLIQNHILTVDLHLEKVLLKKYGRMLKVLMDWLEIQIQVRLLIGHQENLEKGYGVWDMGHIPEAKYSEMHEAYMNGELTTKEFVDWYIMIRNIEKNNLIGVVD